MSPARTRISEDGHVLAYAHHIEERRESETLSRLRALEAELLDGVAVEHRVRIGETVAEILNEVEAFGADLVALSTRRPAWWQRAFGRVAGRVRGKSRVPVMVLADGGAR